MKATAKLHDLGQSLWLDNITRPADDGYTQAAYTDELSVTGLTSNPTIFDRAIKNGPRTTHVIRSKLRAGKTGEDLFFRGWPSTTSPRRPTWLEPTWEDQRRGQVEFR